MMFPLFAKFIVREITVDNRVMLVVLAALVVLGVGAWVLAILNERRR